MSTGSDLLPFPTGSPVEPTIRASQLPRGPPPTLPFPLDYLFPCEMAQPQLGPGPTSPLYPPPQGLITEELRATAWIPHHPPPPPALPSWPQISSSPINPPFPLTEPGPLLPPPICLPDCQPHHPIILRCFLRGLSIGPSEVSHFRPMMSPRKLFCKRGAQERDLESLPLRGHRQMTFSLQGAQPVGRGFWEHRVLTWP